MSYSLTAVTGIHFQEYDGGVIVYAHNSESDMVVQCYVSGQLVACQDAPDETVEFALDGIGECDIIWLLAVDLGEETTDYWSTAYPDAVTYGNRITVQTPQLLAYDLHDVLKVYRGDAGDESADTLVHTQEFYPGGARAGGFGFHFGYGGFGWDGYDCKGFGYNFGLGEFGYDCDMLEWESEPLPPGAYPVKITVEDSVGNESTADTDTVTLATYARPATNLTVTSYTKATDILVLGWDASEDIS